MQPNNTKRNIIIIVIVAVFALGLSLVLREDTATQVSPNDTTSKNDTVKEKNRLIVTDQFPGDVVFVSSITLETGGWVVIHEADDKGNTQAVIGSRYFSNGTYPGEVELTKSLVDGKRYIAMLHSDDGDQKFDPSKDLPIKNTRSAVIQVFFQARADLPEQKG